MCADVLKKHTAHLCPGAKGAPDFVTSAQKTFAAGPVCGLLLTTVNKVVKHAVDRVTGRKEAGVQILERQRLGVRIIAPAYLRMDNAVIHHGLALISAYCDPVR
jgi:hypothetical protein